MSKRIYQRPSLVKSPVSLQRVTAAPPVKITTVRN
jgi:hypothetical protein